MMSGIAAGTVIALDTSTAAMAGAVIENGAVKGETQAVAERNHSVHVISHMKSMLDQAGVGREELDGIVVGQGPGSYTGVRIAVTAAKTLGWAWDKPVVGISSLEALGYGALHQCKAQFGADAGEYWIMPVMDARRGQVYTGGFRWNEQDGGNWTRWADDGILLMKEWVDALLGKLDRRLSEEEGRPVLVVAGDLTQHEEEAERLNVKAAESGVRTHLLPYTMEGQYLARLGLKALNEGAGQSAHDIVPNYTQLTEAEVKLKAKQAGEQS
ncbi:tRNA (adenosine(37)-N6)-threonylcarbamoyltransferase complex dimerization subunit type 1 TsaB [Paenibacillus sp. J5C_2022]|uniref:tRNA (adenosine(37)-N6)-threonylcarbamoyltransferase complex dimerization subunit type 1 TsaB n=1 Tax=Paenibacillus sp. J5C2022 TaxID=2977129 RepID=UPI0021D2A977|nr:tRNA (adenosine(37)-N6)-threonylcarbamoyltransferase complex dimerization subunit type 1 TsaB [Paenibacillus sp. J5C2022]MCU6711825.1 tRNA (adenosine(37)-N6)-threonylcarbamoyltransferase complex dimerization subunit type 1 TsaB [Paenibacillus sp. J5C2022]